MSKYDIIIVGGGHNGLICASYLAKRKFKTLILEKNTEVGGLANCGSTINSLSSKIVKDLNMNLIQSNKPSYTVALEPSNNHTVIEERYNDIIFHSTSADQESQKQFKSLVGKYKKFSSSLRKFMYNEPPRLKSGKNKDAWQLIKMGWSIRGLGKRNMREFLRIIGLNIADELEDNISNDTLKGLLAYESILGSNLGPRSPGTVLTLLYKQAIQEGLIFNFKKYERNEFLSSLEGMCLNQGVEIRKNSGVKNIILDGHSAKGVRLENNEEIFADIIISNVDPKRTYFNLLGTEALDTDFIRRANNVRAKGNVAKLNLSLREKPIINSLEENKSNAKFVYAPDINYIENSFNASKYNGFSENLCIEFKYDENIIDANLNYIPYVQNTTHDKEKIIQQSIDLLKPFIDNLNVTNATILTPNDIESKFHVTGGSWNHGEFEIDQLFMMRPFYGSAQYQTPINNLYLCSAGTHPGGGITGINGHNTAKKILEEHR